MCSNLLQESPRVSGPLVSGGRGGGGGGAEGALLVADTEEQADHVGEAQETGGARALGGGASPGAGATGRGGGPHGARRDQPLDSCAAVSRVSRAESVCLPRARHF